MLRCFFCKKQVGCRIYMQKGNYNSTPALFLVYMVLKCCFSNAKNLFKVRFLASLMVFCDSDWPLVSNLGVPFSLFCWSLGVRSGPVTCVWVCQSLIRATMTGNIFCFFLFCAFLGNIFTADPTENSEKRIHWVRLN